MSSCPVTRFSQACPSRPADAVTVARGGLFAGTAPSSPGLHSPSGSFSASSWLLPPPDSHQGSPQSTGGAWLRFHTQAPGPTRPCRPARQVPQRPWAADQPSHQQRQTRPVHWPLSDNWSPYTQVPTKPYTLQDSPSLL